MFIRRFSLHKHPDQEVLLSRGLPSSIYCTGCLIALKVEKKLREGRLQENNKEQASKDIEESATAIEAEHDEKAGEGGELDRIAAERDELYEKFMRAKADLENYRRRVEKEKSDLLNYGLESFLKDLLPVLDSFDKAIEDRKDGDKEAFADGVEMVRKQFLTVLEKSGLTPIVSAGQSFDPNLHQAIQRVEKEGLDTEMVDQEFAKGYLLNGRLLRPSMVTVAVPKA